MRMNAVPSLPTAGLRPLTGVVPAAVRRTNSRVLLLALLAVLTLTVVAMGFVPQVWTAPLHIKLSRLTETLAIGVLIVVGNLVADEAVERGVSRVPAYAAAVLAGALTGAWLGPALREGLGLQFAAPGMVMNAAHRFTHPVEMAVFGTLVGGLATIVRVNWRTAVAARRRQHEAERARALAQRRTLESQLQALQARVEPMFLFGTLERIQQLYRSDAAAAGAMLEDLIVFLRSALPHLRASSSTVAQELQLARAWLAIVERGSGGPWQLDIEADDPVRGARMPALVLLPLVQCAIDARDDGPLRLRVRVTRHDPDSLRIDVHTSTAAFGGGLDGTPQITPIGERLQALYGARAGLACGPDAGARGGRCTVVWPLQFDDADPPAEPAP